LNPNRLKELINDPLLSSARVLDGLFYSGAIVVEADSDARFYHIASNKRRNDIDLHFVNADNKQTVPQITRMYRDMGVRCVGIVDFDVLNNRVEFAKQMENLAFSEKELSEVLATQEAIAQAAKEITPNERLKDLKLQINELLDSINALQGRKFATKEESKLATEKLLQHLEGRFREAADSTKGWRKFKQQGRSALPPNIQSQFDSLWEICAAQGLFINPCGELESMLIEYGVPYTTDKRGWIVQALKLLPYIEIEDEKYPWRFVKSIHEQLY
jgi:hypothetical protein